MFNTQIFIVEVQKRPCLWNIKDGSYTDRQLKLRAWDDIAKVLNTSNSSYSLNNTSITIDELQRKWKHLRDYYIREKKRTSTADFNTESNATDSGGCAVRKKRKSTLLQMLQFLDASRGTDVTEVIVERNAEDENFYPETNGDDKSVSEFELVTARPSKIQRVEDQSHLINLNEDNVADKQFLTSLLPFIKKMNVKERFKFRAQLINSTLPQERPISRITEKDKSGTPDHRKRHKMSCSSEEIEIINKETNSAETISKRDEFSIYGEYVANKLRNIENKHARHTAEFHINSILYKAEMGEYDNVSKDRPNATRSSSSREFNDVTLSTVTYKDYPDDIITTVIKTEDSE